MILCYLHGTAAQQKSVHKIIFQHLIMHAFIFMQRSSTFFSPGYLKKLSLKKKDIRSIQSDILLSIYNNFANTDLRKTTPDQAEVYLFFTR